MKEIGPKILEFNGVPAFVVLRYDEYQRLIAMASASAIKSAAADWSPAGTIDSNVDDDLLTPTTDLAALHAVQAPPESLIPDDNLIPHDVVVAAVHNHWSLARAWREYLSLNQATMAERVGVSVSDYVTMELEFARLSPATRERLAEGLGVGLQQLVMRRRRRRRKDYDEGL
ncbi:helix-turn-helix domain-containing protein [Achromobacter spanius]|uniref:Uncharacterized protein n=1 Tax=Achromobacter spanius TaxID=217203 RepID=A0A2S0IDS9_9BURK|nr:helix-turn-helix transcriptional regulator [Achromobacter spanius]AVJ30144.1 hypothetical protein CLM73_25295 [Achromobacter spanius]